MSFIAGFLIRFGKIAVIFLVIVVVVWLIMRVATTIIRWILDQLGIELRVNAGWLKSKLPTRKKKFIDVDNLSADDLQKLADKIAEKLEENAGSE